MFPEFCLREWTEDRNNAGIGTNVGFSDREARLLPETGRERRLVDTAAPSQELPFVICPSTLGTRRL